MHLCQQGWHTAPGADGPVFVRFATRLRDRHGTIVNRIGSRPDDAACATIWCHEDRGRPWTCTACGAPIDRQAARATATLRRPDDPAGDE